MQIKTGLLALLGACLTLAFGASVAGAQDADPSTDIILQPTGQMTLYTVAVPGALNLGDVPDTRGVTEALTGTINRDLKIAGYFDLLDPKGFLGDPKAEGMSPQMNNWFNIGAQGLVKVGYTIIGNSVAVDMRLYAVDKDQRVQLPPPYDKPQKLPLDASKLRFHAHGFVNQIIKHFTGTEGFFQNYIVTVKRVGKNKELFRLAPDGSDEVKLTNDSTINMIPNYTKGRIFYTSFRNRNPSLYVLEGGSSRPFTQYPGLNTGAVMSPDGKYVAAVLSKDGNAEIYLLNPADGSVVKRLTNSYGIDTSPSWSPDGKQIAFVSDRHGSPQIWVMGWDGSNARRLTFQGDYNQTPDWNPRGDLIAFTARDERNKFDIFTVNVSNGQIQRLTQGQGNNEEPSWSPNGRYLAFTSTRTGESKLYIMTADGRIQTPVSMGKGGYYTPSWGR